MRNNSKNIVYGKKIMIQTLETFQKQHDMLLCMDSDGTVIDAMNAKHNRCHGEAFIEEWNLQDHAHEIQTIWNEINLYEKSRGVNRFIALEEMLRRLEGRYLHTDGNEYGRLQSWINKGDLSNNCLQTEIQSNPGPLLEKAMRWSLSLNKKIAGLTPEDKPPYPGVREALDYALGKLDIAVISSSNMSAILEEWQAHDLLSYPSVITSQEIGTKEACIAALLQKGYAPDHVLMIGDAYPDVEAALANSVWYYPICTRREGESWIEFRETYLDIFLSGNYRAFSIALMEKFENNFNTQGA